MQSHKAKNPALLHIRSSQMAIDMKSIVGESRSKIPEKNKECCLELLSWQVGMALVSNPEVMLDDDVAAEVAVKFLTKKGLTKFSDPNEATIYYADINSGSPKKRARENSMKELQKFDIA